MANHGHNTSGLPSASLLEIHDCLTLALDATEKPRGYTQSEREARSYLRVAVRKVTAILAEGSC